MSAEPVAKVLIVGGGTAGWMTASALSKLLGSQVQLTLVESDEIGIVGVGEATIPPIKTHNTLVGIDEAEFVRETQGTFKLGIEFVDWGKKGDAYIHGFGTLGFDVGTHPFHHFWARARLKGIGGDLSRYSFNVLACRANKFMATPTDAPKNSPLADIAYAYHFDASLYARYLRTISERAGVKRIEGKVVEVIQNPENGFVRCVKLASGEELSADLFIDCSGFRGLLISETLQSPYVDWTKWLPCDRAMAVPCSNVEPPIPYTRSTAKSAGWQWRIPLQHRIGNGYVYSSAHCTDDEAREDLLQTLGEKPLAEPRVLRFVTGRRKLYWNRNCVALGLASGFLEPLESTSIHLVMSGVYKLLEHFPNSEFAQSNIDSYNSETIQEMERIRDFIVLHYCLTERTDTPLWRYCRSMKLPESLLQRIEIYRRTGRVRVKAGELFSDLSWFYIFDGLGVRPETYDPLMDVVTLPQLRDLLSAYAQATDVAARAAPSHDSYFADGLASR